MSRRSSGGTTRHNSRAFHDDGYEGRLQEAIAAKRGNGEEKDYNWSQLARKYGVNPQTLRDRARGKHSAMANQATERRLLNDAQEQALLSWAEQKAASAVPWDMRDLRQFASELVGKRVGKNWATRFIERHPEILKAKPAKLDPKRAKNFNQAVMNDFYDKLESLFAEYGDIPAEHIWNMDEKGIQLGGGRKGSTRKYMYFRSHRNRYKISSDNLELVTVVECINAAGASMPASFVLSDGPLPDPRRMSEEDVAGVATSSSGWTDDELTLKWIEETFIPNARKAIVDPTKPIILTYDGHGSHETPELRRVVYTASEDGPPIILFCFPSKTTHKVQPLDVVVFAQSQRGWRDYCDECLLHGITMNRYNVITHYINMRKRHITPELIKLAFERTGIYPVNRNVFKPIDFAPSQAFSTQAFTPATYPDDVPSSDFAIPSDAETEDLSDRPDQDGHDASNQKRKRRRTTILDANLSTDEESDAEYIPDEEGEDTQLGWEGSDVEEEDSESRPSKRRPTRFSSPSEFLEPADLIADCYRKLAEMQYISDEVKTEQELFEEVLALRKQVNLLADALETQCALTAASNAHCTIARREISQLRTQLDNSRRQTNRGITKVKARFLTLPAMKAAFEAEEQERISKEQAAAEKSAQRMAEQTEQEAHIRDAAVTQVFDQPLTSYKRKDDLRTIHLAIRAPLPEGVQDSKKLKIAELLEIIKAHLNGPQAEALQSHPRFQGLYSVSNRGKRRRVEPASDEESDSDLPENYLEYIKKPPSIPHNPTSLHPPHPPSHLLQYHPFSNQHLYPMINSPPDTRNFDTNNIYHYHHAQGTSDSSTQNQILYPTYFPSYPSNRPNER